MHFDGSNMLKGWSHPDIPQRQQGSVQVADSLHGHYGPFNMAKYEALLHRLRMAKEMGISRIVYYSDSEFVVQ
jgi:ribonuclease HI